MKIQMNCTCGAKIIIYHWWFSFGVTKYLDRFTRKHAGCKATKGGFSK